MEVSIVCRSALYALWLAYELKAAIYDDRCAVGFDVYLPLNNIVILMLLADIIMFVYVRGLCLLCGHLN